MIHGYEGTKGIADILAAFKTAKETHPNLELWQGESYPLGSTNIPWRTYELVHKLHVCGCIQVYQHGDFVR